MNQSAPDVLAVLLQGNVDDLISSSWRRHLGVPRYSNRFAKVCEEVRLSVREMACVYDEVGDRAIYVDEIGDLQQVVKSKVNLDGATLRIGAMCTMVIHERFRTGKGVGNYIRLVVERGLTVLNDNLRDAGLFEEPQP